MDENAVSHAVIGAAIEVHRTLSGPGLLESVYEEALVWELSHSGILVERQKYVSIRYKSVVLATPLRLDLLIGGCIVVECKSTIEYNSLFEAQVLTYLRLTGLHLGLLINFGERLLKNGIHRVVNKL